MKLEVVYTREAADDLDSIFDYISDDNRTAAKKLLERIEEKILLLADNPRRGVVVRLEDADVVAPGYRRIAAGPYIVFYRFDRKNIFVARVLHEKRDWLYLLSAPE